MSEQPPPTEPGYVRMCLDIRELTPAQLERAQRLAAGFAAVISKELMAASSFDGMIEVVEKIVPQALGMALRANAEGAKILVETRSTWEL